MKESDGMTPRTKAAQPASRLRIVSLGGVDEIGKNMTVFEYEDDIVVVDCGSIFPKEDMLGVDLVIPDVSYLVEKKRNVRGYLFTHGHEDHIGATPYILRQVPAPLYGTKLTLALVDLKLKEHRIQGIPMQVVQPRDEVRLGKNFTAKFIHVSHSIAGACAIALTCPAGTVVVTGDFKIDYTPVDGHITDLASFAELGERGVLAMLCESTNVERPGHTISEKKIGVTFENMFRDAQGRVIVAMFASNIHRMQMVIDNALRYGRRVCFIGRSMVNVSRVAMQIGELRIPPEAIIEADALDQYPDNEILVMTTGSQGEPMSALYRMAFGDHNQVTLGPSDLVVLSASAIPGNEKLVGRIINELAKMDVQVINDSSVEVHVSGHACQEELKLMQGLVHPRYLMPVHGEYKHLAANRELGLSMGIPSDHIFISDIGKVLEIDEAGAKWGGTVPAGIVLVDGYGVGDVGNIVLRDRKHLSQDGLIVVVATVDENAGQLVSGPDIVSRGFVYVRESEDLMEEVRRIAAAAINSCIDRHGCDWYEIKNRIKDDITRFLYTRTKRKPMILPIVMDV